jgi:hypothetical protein
MNRVVPATLAVANWKNYFVVGKHGFQAGLGLERMVPDFVAMASKQKKISKQLCFR